MILFTTEYDFDYIKANYLDNNDLTECTDEDVYSWINDEQEMDWENFLFELEQYDAQSNYHLLTGSCGLWNGRHAGGKVASCLKDLITQAAYAVDVLTITLEHGVICFTGAHHDGRNIYEIRPLSAKGVKYVDAHPYEEDTRELHEYLLDKKGTKLYKVDKCSPQKIVFRAFNDGEDVIALFAPAVDRYRNGVIVGKGNTSYMHVGQQAPYDISVMQETRPASRAEYAPLLAELKNIGYNNLIIRKTV